MEEQRLQSLLVEVLEMEDVEEVEKDDEQDHLEQGSEQVVAVFWLRCFSIQPS